MIMLLVHQQGGGGGFERGKIASNQRRINQKCCFHETIRHLPLFAEPSRSAALQLNMPMKMEKRGKGKVENHGSAASNNNFHPSTERDGQKESETTT